MQPARAAHSSACGSALLTRIVQSFWGQGAEAPLRRGPLECGVTASMVAGATGCAAARVVYGVGCICPLTSALRAGGVSGTHPASARPRSPAHCRGCAGASHCQAARGFSAWRRGAESPDERAVGDASELGLLAMMTWQGGTLKWPAQGLGLACWI